MTMAPLTDQAPIDAHRSAVGWIGYCPVCRRPASASPIGPVAGAGRVADHLWREHPFEAALLRAQLARLPDDEPAPNPFCPTGDDV